MKKLKKLNIKKISEFLNINLSNKKYLKELEQEAEKLNISTESLIVLKILLKEEAKLEKTSLRKKPYTKKALKEIDKTINELEQIDKKYKNENTEKTLSLLNYYKYENNLRELEEQGFIFRIEESNGITIDISFSTDFIKMINEEDKVFLNNIEIELKEKNNYMTNKEYIIDIFKYIKQLYKYKSKKNIIVENGILLTIEKQKKKALKELIKERLKNTKEELKNSFALYKFIEDKKLTEKQKDVIYSIYKGVNDINGDKYREEKQLIEIYMEKEPELLYEYDDLFGLNEYIEVEEIYIENNIEELYYGFTENILEEYDLLESNKEELSNNKEEIGEENSTKKTEKQKKENKKIGLEEVKKLVKSESDFEVFKSKKTINDIILSKETKELVDLLLKQLDTTVIEQLREWGIIEDEKIKARILFSGKPGTGKTATAEVIANSLNRYVISFDCSKILGMYVGESEKNVKAIFDTYKKVQKKLDYSPILLLNEADQFLSKRTSATSSVDKMHNQMQNIFLEEIEKFEGILIATTNLIENLDTAFSRRFNHKIEFKIPDKKQRLEIWKQKTKKLPKKEKFEFDKIANYELTGGQIELVTENTAKYNAVNKIKVFEEKHFITQIEKELSTTFDKSGKKMGFVN